MEQWKVIPQYPDYAVSNTGRVRLIVNRYKSKIGFEPKPSVSKKGYLRVALFNGPTRADRQYESIHKLVAKAFLPNPLNLPTVNHKQEPKTNNAVENLEWASYTRQMWHAQQTGLRPVKGYTYVAGQARPWIAQMESGGRKHRKARRIGAYATEAEAIAARAEAVAIHQNLNNKN